MKDHNLLVSLEGIDRTGKTQIVEAIRVALGDRSLPVHTIHDPPRLDPWEDIQEKHLDRVSGLSDVGVAHLFLAARLDGVQREVIPALAEETFVIADRYIDSWVAYHGHRLAPRIGTLDGSISFLKAVHEHLSNAGLLPFPRQTWLIRDDLDLALQRRAEGESQWESPQVQREVADVYERLANEEPKRIRVVDARGKTLDEVKRRVVAEALDYCVREADTF